MAANLPWAQKLAPDKPLPFFFCTRRGIEPAMLSAPRGFKWWQFLLQIIEMINIADLIFGDESYDLIPILLV